MMMECRKDPYTKDGNSGCFTGLTYIFIADIKSKEVYMLGLFKGDPINEPQTFISFIQNTNKFNKIQFEIIKTEFLKWIENRVIKNEH
jgi:hypothetical protein